MYNEKIKASIYKYFETHKEQVATYKREYNRKHYAERMENDPEFKAKENERIKNICKTRYANDPEYKAKKNEQRKALYHKKKEELLKQQTAIAMPIIPILVEVNA